MSIRISYPLEKSKALIKLLYKIKNLEDHVLMIKASKLMFIWICLWGVVIAFQYQRDGSFFSPKNTTKTSNQLIKMNINLTPKNARIRVMNIKQKFSNGMPLAEGKYRLVIDAPQYKSKDLIINLDKSYTVLTIELKRS